MDMKYLDIYVSIKYADASYLDIGCVSTSFTSYVDVSYLDIYVGTRYVDPSF